MIRFQKSEMFSDLMIVLYRKSEILQLQHLERRREMYARYAAMRDARNLKDIDVSRETGIPASTFTDWKNGKSSPKIDKIIKIADLFQVSLDDFVREQP